LLQLKEKGDKQKKKKKREREREKMKKARMGLSKRVQIKEKKNVGLWVRNLMMFNHALLKKWLWHYLHEREGWCRVMVDSKFGRLWGGWCSNEPLGMHGLGLWKNIKRGWGKLSNPTKFEVGDGSKVKSLA